MGGGGTLLKVFVTLSLSRLENREATKCIFQMRGGRKGGQQRVSEERSRVNKVSKNVGISQIFLQFLLL